MSGPNRRKLSFLGFGTENNGDPNEVHLDDEMEKVFAATEKFTVAQLSDDIEPKSDSSHRNHGPRKSLTSSMKRRESKDSTAPSTPIASPQRSVHSADSEALVSERAGHVDHHSDSDDERRVQFNKSDLKDPQGGNGGDTDEDLKKKLKGRHQHYKRRKASLQEGGGSAAGRRVSVQPEDAVLEEADIDDLISHRSDDPRGMRRPKIMHEKLALRNDSTVSQPLSPKKSYDHSPHKVFVQLDELQGIGEDREWKETARWIKYEEDVEEGSDRWGKPHVAPLSFHSLLNLRRCLETGVVILDLDEKDLPGVAYRVVEQMVVEELIEDDDKPTLMRALLLRHRHVNEHGHGAFGFVYRRKFSSYTSLQYLMEEELRHRNSTTTTTPRSADPNLLSEQIRRHSTMSHKNNLSHDQKSRILHASEANGNGVPMAVKGSDTRIDIREEIYASSQEDFKKLQSDTILKRIPVGAEATTVLVGAVDFLKQPTIAFIRLAEGIPIPGVTEVPIPVRFIFILLGPKTVELDYHEVGRSIATLMSNEHFHNIAYKADDRRDLLSAINEFLDDSIVLPPGNWQREDLLPFEELKAKSEWIRERKNKALLEKNKSKDKQAIADEEKKLLAAADADEDQKGPPNPLKKTHRLWGGLFNDVKRRLPMFKSDIVDGFNSETLAATIFMYFASLSTAITFGAMVSEKTTNLIGISETLLAASVTGVIFHTFSGQPLTIIGTTGPLILFDEALFQFCNANTLPFLAVRAYIGIWLVIIALVVSALEGSVYVRLFTRFTQECFSALITLIYIVETGMKLFSVYRRHPLYASYEYLEESVLTLKTSVGPHAEALIGNTTTALNLVGDKITALVVNATAPDIAYSLLAASDKIGPKNQPNTALFCTMLTLGTFTVAYFLRIFRNSHFLGRNARRALGDFGVPIAIAIFVALDFIVPQVYTEKLSVPEGLSPSDPTRRGWMISLDIDQKWLPFAAGVPALLVYILAFMETHISELIVDKPERGLKKGSGLHWDIVLLCFLNTFCGFFGMPWHCAATVRSVTHVSAVTIMSTTHAPGDKPHIADVKEQRLSGFFVSLFVGLSVTAAPLLRLIPMSVLFGVFLYMGIASMSGIQLFERLGLFFMPVKYHPTEPYVRRVPTWKMHCFTLIQILGLAILWAVKSSSISLAFPFVLVMLVPLRQHMSKFFSEPELNALDGNQAAVDPNDEPDFYQQASIPA